MIKNNKIHQFAAATLLVIFTGSILLARLQNPISLTNHLTKGKSDRRSGFVLPEVVNAAAPARLKIAAPSQGFMPQTRVGFTHGDQWEPAIAADSTGHIYILYPQYLGVPGCTECASPAMVIQTSADHGATWDTPRLVCPEGALYDQVDAQIVVEPEDGETVYAAWMQNLKADIVVAKSVDFGQNWTYVTANHTKAATDKPWLAVRGQDVYVAYNHVQKMWVSHSHDGGASFTSTVMNQNAKLGFSLAGGGTVTPNGDVFFSWIGYEQHGKAKGPGNLYVSISRDKGQSWTTRLIDVSAAPVNCSDYECGWAYLSAQMTMTSDSAGSLYGLWNANDTNGGPTRLYFSKSLDGGDTWAPPLDSSDAPNGVNHAFPAIAAGEAGDVRITWMDTRSAPLWNTYFRQSSDGGASWSSEVDLSSFTPGFDYIFQNGFSFPFGDYFELDIDDRGNTHAVWGEGLNYNTPGSIWYTNGNP